MPTHARFLKAMVEPTLVFGLGVALGLAANFELVLHAGSALPSDLVDPALQAWEVAWGGHALLHQPLAYFQANAFWPLQNSLAFSDALVGYAPVGLFGHGVGAAVLRHNLLVVFAYALAFAGAYALARELGVSRGAACVSGAAFAFAPWRLAHVTQLNVLSSGGIALALFLLIRGYRRVSSTTLAAGFAVAGWQLSLGFNLGLPFTYLLGVLTLAAATAAVRSGRRGLLVMGVTGFAVVLAIGLLLAQPYLSVADEYPEARRTALEVSALSPVPESFFAAPERNLVWGELTAPMRERLRSSYEQTLFPGVAICVLALLGLTSRRIAGRLRLALVVAGLAFTVLALGFHVSAGRAVWLFPYRLLYEFAPGWDALRTPGRLTTFSSLAVAVLVGYGADRFRGRGVAGKTALAACLVLAVAVEGAGRVPAVDVPSPPAVGPLREPILYLPSEHEQDALYMLWSTDGFPALVNGYSGFRPHVTERLRRLADRLPDARAARELQRRGVATVVRHQGNFRQTQTERVVVYRLRPVVVSPR
jgi:hypothetical protein